VTDQKKERHHYVPVFYLQEFTDDDEKFLWAYDKSRGSIVRAAPRDLGLEKHYYSYTTGEGERDSSTVEDALEKIDGLTAPILRKLLAGEALGRDDRSVFCYFMALQMARGPVHRQNYEKIAEAGARVMLNTVATKGPAEVDDVEITVNPQISLEGLAVAQHIAPVFDRMAWLIVTARGRYRFVTSDNPVVYADLTHDPNSLGGAGLLSPNTEVTFPLSRGLALAASWQGPHNSVVRIKGTEPLVKRINRWTIAGAKRFVFASQRSDGLMRFVSKFKGSFVPRVEVVSPPSAATIKPEPAK
jgi:hypothetical protein